MQAEAVPAELVRPLRSSVLRPGRAGEELVFAGDEEPTTLHTAVRLGGLIVGVASVMRDRHPRDPREGDWRIRGMASSAQHRGSGIGGVLLARCEAHARAQGGLRLWCNARVRARPFYERAGMRVEGEAFELASIGEHYLMCKRLRSP